MSTSQKKLTTEKIVALTAIIISLCALVVSFYEVRIMRTQQKASVWPYITMNEQYSSEGFALEASNKGLGPAKIESVRAWVKGENVTDLNELLDGLLGADHGITYKDYSVAGINETVLEPGYKKPLVRLPWTEKSREFQRNVNKINIEVIYSSILGDCWKLSLVEVAKPCECPDRDKETQFYF